MHFMWPERALPPVDGSPQRSALDDYKHKTVLMPLMMVSTKQGAELYTILVRPMPLME